jgi:hypothetical protein
MTDFKPGDRIRAVRDTTSQYGALIPKGATGTVIGSAYADLAFRPDDSALGTARLIRRPEDFEHEPASSELYIDSGLADHARFQLDGDGIALDLFTPGTRAHISGRRLDSAQIQDLLQWLADHGHTLDETDTPKPKPVTGRGTAYVFGMVPQGVDQRRYHGFLRDSGSFVFFDDEGALSYALPDQYDGFEPDPKSE